MKKMFAILLVFTQLVAITPTVLADKAQITILVNNQQIQFDVEPFMLNSKVMVPFRAIAEALKNMAESIGV